MQELHSHTVSRCPNWYLRYSKKTPGEKKKNTHTHTKQYTHKKNRESPRRLLLLEESLFLFWFLAYRKPSTLQILKYSALSSKTYMLNSESISETFHLQAALRGTVVTGSSWKKTDLGRPQHKSKKCVYEYMKSGRCRPLLC